MTVQELCARFPEIPADLREEPALAELAERCGPLLAVAHKPGNCSTGYDAGNHYYMKLVSPIAVYAYGLATREKVVSGIRDLVERHQDIVHPNLLEQERQIKDILLEFQVDLIILLAVVVLVE